MSNPSVLVVCFWVGAALVVYTYAVYPVLIWALSRLFGRRPEIADVGDDELPTMSMVLAAYNEEAVIDDRIRNALEMDYPREKLELVIGSDGSTDRTAEIVRRYADRGVRLLNYARNRGKASVLNDAVAAARGEILLMSDANTQIEPWAGRRLAAWFRDPRIGAVVGRLVLTDPETGQNADGLYWKYETFLKKSEGRLGALLGANGAIYSIRRELFTPIPAETIIDDFVIPLLAKIRSGCEIVYDPTAAAHEETAPDMVGEFHRRARIGAGGFQSIGMLRELLDPRQGWVAFTFLSHKILRWFCPFFLVGMLAASLLLWERPFFRACVIAQFAFYLISIVTPLLPARVRVPSLLRLASMFTGMNAALFVGFLRWLTGRQKGAWRRTPRASEVSRAIR
jgi:cellulose synthase/poly-beta-1,6-N-acetylglucosamine synthase-like glycosyltransferase